MAALTTIAIPAGTIVLTRDGLVTTSVEVESPAWRMRDGTWRFTYNNQPAECAGGLATFVAGAYDGLPARLRAEHPY